MWCPYPTDPGVLCWVAVIDGKDQWVDGPESIIKDGETIIPRSRTFIPSLVDDNPFLARTAYKSVLQSLPGDLREKFLSGDFNATGDDDPFQLIPSAWIDAAMARWQPNGGEGIPMDGLGADPTSGLDVALPPDRELKRELAAPRYEITSGKIKVESKEDIIKRVGKSPDKGDAVILARKHFRKQNPLTAGKTFTAETDFGVL